MIEHIVCGKFKDDKPENNSRITIDLRNLEYGQEDSSIQKKMNELLQTRNKASFCSKCRRVTNSTAKFEHEFSEYMCLRIDRSDNNQKTNKLERISQRITPEKLINIRQNQREEITQYRLIGGIAHSGSALSGHYITTINVSNQWLHISDNDVTEISEANAIQQLKDSGVLIVYRKSQTQAAQQADVQNYNTTSSNYNKGESYHGSQQWRQKRDNKSNDSSTSKPKKPPFFRPFKSGKFPKQKRKFWTKKIYTQRYVDKDKKVYYVPKE